MLLPTYILILCITKLLGDILRTVLALYMDDEDLPLPTLEEVLICNSTTTAEEVFYDVDDTIDADFYAHLGFKRIFRIKYILSAILFFLVLLLGNRCTSLLDSLELCIMQ